LASNGTNLGLKMGLMGEFYFQENYALATGLGFSFNSGGTLLHSNTGIYWANSEVPADCAFFMEEQQAPNLKYSIQYVEIPIGLKMRTREFGYIRYFMEPNVGIGFRTQAKGDIRNADDAEECNDINIRPDVRLLNLFWGLNGGIEYSVSESTSLVAGIGLQFGFTDVTCGWEYCSRGEEFTRRSKRKGPIFSILSDYLGVRCVKPRRPLCTPLRP
jgi:hypothetical protein